MDLQIGITSIFLFDLNRLLTGPGVQEMDK
jgi:hypothetical protein